MIKKAVIALAVIIFAEGAALALSASQQTTFTVTVSSIFELSIDQGMVDFGRMKPGETKWNMPSSGVNVVAKTNNGKPWYIKVSNSSPLNSANNIIPNNNFYWSGWTDGTGKWYGSASDQISTAPKIVYGSGVGEENNLPNGTANHFKFKLAVPSNQAPGFYMTTVKFTMTE
ncbi:MAG: hypothetical protein AABZ57_01480 [Candidatus Margulisiibacteriota bacterium]